MYVKKSYWSHLRSTIQKGPTRILSICRRVPCDIAGTILSILAFGVAFIFFLLIGTAIAVLRPIMPASIKKEI